MDSLKCQTSTVSPAKPGDFPIGLKNGKHLCLTPQERRVIEILSVRAGTWVHKERLLQLVYESSDQASESGLKSLIMRLRRKIGPGVIVTGYGLG